MTSQDGQGGPFGAAIDLLGFEARLLSYACFSPRCFMAKAFLLIGFGYWVGPWDIIPSRVPVFGHMDEAAFVLGGLLLAHIATRADFGFQARENVGPSRFSLAFLRLQSAALAEMLAVKRRISRAGPRARTVAAQVAVRRAGVAREQDFGSRVFELLGYRLWWTLRAPFARRASDRNSIVVIGGSPRSGTTLLRTVLGRHPLIASLPETTVFLHRISSPEDIGARVGWPAGDIRRWQRQSRSQMEFIERFHDEVRHQSGKPIWAEKTPWNVQRFGFARRRFPRAKLVHIVRDGRDVVCSLRRKPFSKAEREAADSPEAARRCALQWRAGVTAGLRYRGNPAYYELRYEDLVRAPEPALRALLAFLNIPWDERVLHAGEPASVDPDDAKAAGTVFTSSISRWRQDLTPQDTEAIRVLTAPLLIELGYEGTG